MIKSIVFPAPGARLLLATLPLVFAYGAPAQAPPAKAVPASPSAAYRWQNVKLGGGGFVSGIVAHPRQRGLWYARTDVGGAYRWDDTAKTWVPLNDEFDADQWTWTGIESMGIDPTDANRLYLAVGTYTNDWGGNGAILRSTDQGRHFQRTDLPFKNGGNEDGRWMGERLAVDPGHTNRVYFGSRTAGLWRSDDYGATWKAVTTFPALPTPAANEPRIGICWVTFAPPASRDKGADMAYASVYAKDGALYRSRDGATWEKVPGQPQGFYAGQGRWDKDGTLYVTYVNGPGPNGVTDGAVWKYQPTGEKWTEVTPHKRISGIPACGYAGLATDAQHAGTLVVSTLDRWSAGDDIFRSTDGGATWKPVASRAVMNPGTTPYLKWGKATPRFGWWIGALALDPFNTNHVLYGTGTTVWGTDDIQNATTDQPTHWNVAATGIEEMVVNDVVSPPSGAAVFSAMWDIDGFRSETIDASPGAGFYQPNYGHATSLDFAEADPNVIVRVHGGSGTHGAYSLDNGKTWSDFASAPTKSGNGKIAVSVDGKTWVWTPENQSPFVTRDRGATWQPCAGLERSSVVSDRVEPGTFYALGADGTLRVSRDSAQTWDVRASGLPIQGSVRAVPGQAGTVFFASDRGLFRFTNFGVNVVPLPGIGDARRVGFGKAAPGRAYPTVFLVGKRYDKYGIYRSDDEGVTWVRVNNDRQQFANINAIAGDPRVYGRVYLATAGRGVIYGEPGR